VGKPRLSTMGRGDVCASRQGGDTRALRHGHHRRQPLSRHHPHPPLLSWLLRAELSRQASTRRASVLPIYGRSCPGGPVRGKAILSWREAWRWQQSGP
jgi:hypothetical protein